MNAFNDWLRTLAPNGRPTAAQWVLILECAALVHPARDAGDGLFLRVVAEDGLLTATAYQLREEA